MKLHYFPNYFKIVISVVFYSFLSCYSCCFLCCYRHIVFAVAIAINIHWYIAVSIATATNRIRDRADQSVAVRSSCRNTTCSIILILPFRHLLTSSLRGLRQLLLSSLAHCLAVAVLATVMILSSKWPSNENTWQELQLQYSSLVYSIYCNYNKCNMSRGVRVRISSRNISAMQGVSVTLPTVPFIRISLLPFLQFRLCWNCDWIKQNCVMNISVQAQKYDSEVVFIITP